MTTPKMAAPRLFAPLRSTVLPIHPIASLPDLRCVSVSATELPRQRAELEWKSRTPPEAFSADDGSQTGKYYIDMGQMPELNL